jgi:hypothetical protein
VKQLVLGTQYSRELRGEVVAMEAALGRAYCALKVLITVDGSVVIFSDCGSSNRPRKDADIWRHIDGCN